MPAPPPVNPAARRPLGFDAGDANLYRYARNRPTAAADPTGLYETDVHFYMTYYLAAALGLSGPGRLTEFRRGGEERYDEAYLIAWATEFTDWHPDTSPYTREIPVRRDFHFRCLPGEKVKAGSTLASEIVDEAIAGEKDLLHFGIGLHAFEDSWSHEGFETDHIRASVRSSTDPDLASNDPEKAVKMAEQVYRKLDAWRKQHAPDARPLKSFDELAGTEKEPGSLRALLRRGGSLAERNKRWQAQIKDDFKVDVGYQDKRGKDPWATSFLLAARKVRPPGVPAPPQPDTSDCPRPLPWCNPGAPPDFEL